MHSAVCTLHDWTLTQSCYSSTHTYLGISPAEFREMNFWVNILYSIRDSNRIWVFYQVPGFFPSSEKPPTPFHGQWSIADQFVPSIWQVNMPANLVQTHKEVPKSKWTLPSIPAIPFCEGLSMRGVSCATLEVWEVEPEEKDNCAFCMLIWLLGLPNSLKDRAFVLSIVV